MADILLIDDMAGVRRAVEAMLKSSGHTVTTSDNGSDGLGLLKSRRFDLVITDMLMPLVDGSEVLAELNAMPNHPPVIAMSGGGAGVSADMVLRAAKNTAGAYLQKPFEKTELLAAVERLLSKAG